VSGRDKMKTHNDAVIEAAKKVIRDWHATLDHGVVLNLYGKLAWASLEELELALIRHRRDTSG